MPTVQPVPAGYPRVIPYLTIDGAAAAIDFYREVLGATERMRMSAPNGRIGHAELAFGESVVMLADSFADMGGKTPQQLGGTPVGLMVYVEDVDAAFARAVDRGAQVEQPVENQFYGDRAGMFIDPFGHKWMVATHVEDVPPQEMERRAAEAMGASFGREAEPA